MLLVGYGKLGRAVAVSKNNDPVNVYNRTESKIKEEQEANLIYCGPENFHLFSSVLLCLPPQAYESFFTKYGSYFKEGTIIYHTATAMMQSEVQPLAQGLKVVPCKFAGHALQSIEDRSGGVFVIPRGYREERKGLEDWLSSSFKVIEGKEEDVLEANKASTEEAMRMIYSLQKRLEKSSLPDEAAKQIITQIPRGVIKSYLQGNHGHFAKKVLEELTSEGEER
ncbi:hypothetical protein ACFPU1_08650 [Thalassorhabdus alkalitolerans]|uniref:Pyrroline-5-carboxylate reductase catalytic N-terminal domain-containing protein n=1 Tax=Thalassorhabdus alkalitolerans TaxID=2282697 RepID=A0ABW0YK81_9BACI|nr:hypothetical protein [Thalassobacillus sp. C254]